MKILVIRIGIIFLILYTLFLLSSFYFLSQSEFELDKENLIVLNKRIYDKIDTLAVWRHEFKKDNVLSFYHINDYCRVEVWSFKPTKKSLIAIKKVENYKRPEFFFGVDMFPKSDITTKFNRLANYKDDLKLILDDYCDIKEFYSAKNYCGVKGRFNFITLSTNNGEVIAELNFKKSKGDDQAILLKKGDKVYFLLVVDKKREIKLEEILNFD